MLGLLGEDIFHELKILMAKFNLHFEKLHGISTDGAPAMVGSKVGLTSKIKINAFPSYCGAELSAIQKKKDVHDLLHFLMFAPRKFSSGNTQFD